ncbi:MAG TPA: hypothetical protein VM911_03745 [Pyrinomonadaceae bacterium]|nr:hypothetical protein [Pyrinomonadaceae bacterium]
MFLRDLLNAKLLLIAFIVLTVGACAPHSVRAQGNSNDPFSTGKNDPQDVLLGSPEVEMRARLEIQRAEKMRRENLERAREVAQLGLELREDYTKNRSFDRPEIKKLERLEKLVRRIRSEAGGSDDDETLEDQPRELDGALTRIADYSVELRKGVEKTPRLVISASVIERANELLELINFVRTLTHQAN